MAVNEVELENLIQKDNQKIKITHKPFPTELTNKYLCYIADNDKGFFEKHYQLVIALLPEDTENTECSTLSLVRPTQDSQVILIPKKLVIKLHPDIKILENSNFLQEFIQIIFSQESFEAVELLLHQKIFSWLKFLIISIQFTHVLQFVLSEKLLEYGGILLDSLENGNTLLHLCVYENKCDSIKVILYLIKGKTFQSLKKVAKEDIQNFIDEKNSSDNTALQLCVLKHSYDCLVHLLEAGADIGIVDMNSNSIFHFTGYFDDVESIQIIFSYLESKDGAGLILRDEMKRFNKQLLSPILLSKSIAVIDKFLDYIDLYEEFDESGNLLIHFACKHNNVCLVNTLCSLSGDLNAINKDEKTPLKIAAIQGNVDIVDLLLAAGVSVGEKDEENTALFLAAQMGNIKIVKILIGYGASLYTRYSNVLHAASKGDNPMLIEYLITEQKMDVNTMDIQGESALFKSVKLGYKLCVKYLLMKGANPNQINCEKENMLILAVEHGEFDIVKLLVDFKADTSYVKADGKTSFIIACENDRDDILSLLIGDQFVLENIYQCDKDGNNLFHIAAISDAVKCIDIFIEYFSDKYTTDQTKKLLFQDANNEGLNLYELVLRRRGSHIKYLLSKVPIDYFIDHPHELHRMYDDGNYDLLVIVLDGFVNTQDDVTVYTKCFDALDDGSYPGDKGFHYFKESFFHKLLNCPYETLKYHPVVSLLAKSKYAPYKWISYFELFSHICFLFILAFAFLTASYTCQAELFVYNDPLSICRLVCEVLLLIYLVLFAIAICLHFISAWLLVYENKSEFSRESMTIFWLHNHSRISYINSFKNVTKSNFLGFINWFDKMTLYVIPAFCKHFYQFYNLLNVAALLSGALFIAFRFSYNQNQWAFAALTFSLSSMISLKYVSVLPNLGAYIASILRIFKFDIPKFVIVVLLVLFSYVGSIHLAGRFETQRRQANNSVCLNDSSYIFWFNSEDSLGYTIKNPVFSGSIFVLDGGPGNVESSLLNLSFVYVSIYLFFSFLVIIILLNILIAQLSQTYAEISAEREFHFIFQLVVYYELISTSNLLMGSYFRPRSVIKHIVLSKTKWRKYLNRSPGRSSDLLTRDIDVRSRKINDCVNLVQTVINKMKSSLYISSEIITHLYDNFIERRQEYFREKLPRNVSTSVDVEQINNRLDVLEGKMEKIIQLLENK